MSDDELDAIFGRIQRASISPIDGRVSDVECRRWALPDRRARTRTLRNVSLEWEQTVVDAEDPVALGRWWADALGWVVVDDAAGEDATGEYEIRPGPDRLPGLLFVPVAPPKAVKNRLHLDFRPDDRDAEVKRLVDLGATRADVGQGEQPWVVLADPEGNEFCVLGPRRPTT